jgi:PTH1 family peptidyl-tRNA hydrolase
MLKLLVGLGNPGRKYQPSRHNLGYRVVELIAEKKKKKFKSKKGDYWFSEVEFERNPAILLKPKSFMNLSGIPVSRALKDFDLELENILVLCDDVNLPLGKIRIREKGSDGGHKGLKSIIQETASKEFARLRMGIGLPPEGKELERFVLEKFNKEERKTVEQMIEKAAQAIEVCVDLGLALGMREFN